MRARRQDRRRRSCAARTASSKSVRAGGRRRDRGRPLHRLLGLPRPADRAGAEDRLRGLVALAALRPRASRCPARAAASSTPLHPRHRARRRAGSGASRCSTASATATSIRSAATSATTRRPRPCSPISTASRSRDPLAAALHHRAPAASSGTRTASPSASPAASWSRSNRTSIHLIQTGIARLHDDVPGPRLRAAPTIDALQPADAVRVRAHPRLPRAPLQRDRARRHAVLGLLPQHGDSRTPAEKIDAVPASAAASSARTRSCSPRPAGSR